MSVARFDRFEEDKEQLIDKVVYITASPRWSRWQALPVQRARRVGDGSGKSVTGWERQKKFREHPQGFETAKNPWSMYPSLRVRFPCDHRCIRLGQGAREACTSRDRDHRGECRPRGHGGSRVPERVARQSIQEPQQRYPSNLRRIESSGDKGICRNERGKALGQATEA